MKHIISAGFAEVVPDETTAKQGRISSHNVERGLESANDRLPTAPRGVLPQRHASRFGLLPFWLAAFCVIAAPATSQSDLRPGSKLVGSQTVGPAEQGWSVALSADGSTAIVGGLVDNKLTGAAWIFGRTGDKWSQEGSKLVGTGIVGQSGQGASVALSADGNLAIVGGPFDNSKTGAAWVYTRSANVWSQQGSKLIGSGAIGGAAQGSSVAVSADGSTVVVGGPEDNMGTGAAWVFTRRNGVWTQQGTKLTGAGAIGAAFEGSSIALSADGNTAIVGGPRDDLDAGAAWIFIRSGGAWIQQGKKLVGTGTTARSGQGFSVGIAADGNTAIVSGFGDNSETGAAWVFTRSDGVWTQQGGKLVGNGAVGAARQGHSVALSADGNTALVGGPYDNSDAGAAWVFTRSGTIWNQQGRKLIGNGATARAEQGFSVALSADGNTAIAGGIADNMLTGAAWVHSRAGNVWTQIPAPSLGY